MSFTARPGEKVATMRVANLGTVVPTTTNVSPVERLGQLGESSLTSVCDLADKQTQIGADPVVTEAGESRTDPESYIFRLDGRRWTICFSAKTVSLRDYVGLKDIHSLLSSRDRPLHVHEVIRRREPGLANDRSIQMARSKRDIPNVAKPEPILDDQTLRECHRQLNDNRIELEACPKAA